MKKSRFTFHVSRFTAGIVLALLSVCSASTAVTITEDFSSDPSQNGWKIFGDTNLFQWDSTNHNLAATWDSSQTNSYFYRSLGTILAIDDNFSIEFDLTLNDITTGQTPGEPSNFPLAIGFQNLASATNTAFLRGVPSTPNLFEFDYYGPGQFPPSIDATLADSTVSAANSSDFYFAYDNVALDPGVTYHIVLTHVTGEPSISGQVFTNGQLYTGLLNSFSGPITDFRFDTLAISSYSDAGQDTNNYDGVVYAGSVLAHGAVGNFVVTLPPPPAQNLAVTFSNSVPQVQFTDRTNWLYTLQRSSDLFSWADASPTTPGVDNALILQDTNAPASKAFYRIRAQRP